MNLKILLVIAIMVTLISVGCTNRLKSTTSSEATASNVDENSFTNKYWKLIMLENKKVSKSKNQEREAYFILKPENKTIAGFSGCNTFNGMYTLEAGWRIRFSQMASIMKACPDVDVNESEFLKVFELTDNYTIHGDTLSLNVGRRSPLAVFVRLSNQ